MQRNHVHFKRWSHIQTKILLLQQVLDRSNNQINSYFAMLRKSHMHTPFYFNQGLNKLLHSLKVVEHIEMKLLKSQTLDLFIM